MGIGLLRLTQRGHLPQTISVRLPHDAPAHLYDRWLKEHLRIETLCGTSATALRAQRRIATKT